MLTFADARAAISAAPAMRKFYGDGFQVAEYGWENDEVYLMALSPADGVAIFDAPALLIDKETGKLTEVYGAAVQGVPPAEDLRPIGNPPD